MVRERSEELPSASRVGATARPITSVSAGVNGISTVALCARCETSHSISCGYAAWLALPSAMRSTAKRSATPAKPKRLDFGADLVDQRQEGFGRAAQRRRALGDEICGDVRIVAAGDRNRLVQQSHGVRVVAAFRGKTNAQRVDEVAPLEPPLRTRLDVGANPSHRVFRDGARAHRRTPRAPVRRARRAPRPAGRCAPQPRPPDRTAPMPSPSLRPRARGRAMLYSVARRCASFDDSVKRSSASAYRSLASSVCPRRRYSTPRLNDARPARSTAWALVAASSARSYADSAAPASPAR